DGVPLSGATSSVLTLNGVTSASAGSYAVTVSNSAGSLSSNSAQLTINKATATVTLGGLDQIYDGGAKSATATTIPAGLSLSFNYDGNATPPVNAGHYLV